MQERQRSVEQLSRRITADARRPIWQPIARISQRRNPPPWLNP